MRLPLDPMRSPVVASLPAALTHDAPMPLPAYRAVRARVIASEAVQQRIGKAWAATPAEINPWAYQPLPPQGLAYGRHVIQALRKHALDVLDRLAEFPAHGPTEEAAFARHALRVPDDALPQRSRGARIAHSLLKAFVRIAWWRHISTRLRLIGTPEGRKWVFRIYVGTSELSTRPYYDAALDFFLRHFTLPDSAKVLEDIGWIDECTIRNAWRLGLRSAERTNRFRTRMARFTGRKTGDPHRARRNPHDGRTRLD
ncbi:hypothetical protein KEX41_29465 (plasmid) [Burkholderia thailandensis]|uniref:hypothetical protein n=1 Tax=Burkholderia thailandensis TaxID=57975 RepID=UPI00192D29E4|nr:hypothetical protein [Burkholderia thailandensis]MBS2132312.1 hypothetical protein [Burkholderia thailandensis]QRA15121.1 hypothetical protein JMY07_29890 [Burkholderia thailandensis]